LVCTDADNFLEPSTCVRKREKSIAYLGPWWNSTNCPTMKGFTNAQLVLDGLKVLMLTYPGELQLASHCGEYWHNPLVKANHEVLYNYVAALVQNLDNGVLHEDLNATGKFIIPTFEELWASLANETVEPDGTCVDNESSKVKSKKLELQNFAFQPCYIWSVVHFLTFNQKESMTKAATEASFGIAIWLRRYFSCEDCRSFFDGLVQEPYVGMPDVSDLNRDHHAYWWHHAHNMASEHFASVRGGDPWVAQLWNEDFKKYQNPFMMTWKDAEDQWVSPKRAASIPTDVPSFAKSAFSREHVFFALVLLSAHVASIFHQA